MARKAWLAFYPAFKTAVKKRDRAALRRMMVSKAFDLESEEDSSPDAVFRYLDRTGNDGWPMLDKLVSRGTVTGRGNTRVIELKSIELGAPAGFIYRGGKWYWNIYMAGD